MTMTPEQMRAARALIDWSQSQLAEAAGLSLPSIKRAERDLGANVSAEALAAIQHALEDVGVEFTNGNSPGVKSVLLIAEGKASGGRYLFACGYQGFRFKTAVSKEVFDSFDQKAYAAMPLEGRLKRGAMVIGPLVMRAWKDGRRPLRGTLMLIEHDFRD